jgi:hypothetical protein
MRRCPFTVLVCLSFLIVSCLVFANQSDNFINVVINPATDETHPSGTPGILGTAESFSSEPASFVQASARRRAGLRSSRAAQLGKPIVKCKGPVCAPAPVEPCGPICILPRRKAGQWQLATQVFFARVKGTVRSPSSVFGIPATDIDFNDDLGLPSHQTLLEYSAWYQFRPSWALFYSIMPIQLEGSQIAKRDLYIGQLIFPAGTFIHTNWNFTYQKVGLLYQPVFNCNAAVSIYNSWVFNEQRLDVSSSICAGRCDRIDRTRNMVMSEIEIQKCIRTLCNGGTLSCDNRVGLGYLDGTFALDLQAGMQFSVPMNAGRWGYAKGGYRFINFKEDRTDLRLDTYLEGAFVEAGLIF